ncbi:MAG: methylmalonyl-CoA mutase family protein, partial [Rhodocyclales bacterium]|nr:methylmalonyl-CoA mutase family protein [Rhodocyclales bacterium]
GGYFRSILNRASERHYRNISSGSQQVVGVNCHTMPPEKDHLLRDIAEQKIAPYRGRIEAVKRMRLERDTAAVKQALRQVRSQAESADINLIPVVYAAMRQGSSMGEVAGALRMAYGAPYDPHGALVADF